MAKGDKGPIDLQAKRDERAEMDLLAQTVQDAVEKYRSQARDHATDVINACEQVMIIGVVGGDVVDLYTMAPITPIEGAGILTRAMDRWRVCADVMSEDE